ncbi:MAG: TIGR00730 family Rossman fold protein [Proteobacteria bacterium]|nr:TIGR00730 family Rossman fold protein [Pseudomonadota bacterium]
MPELANSPKCIAVFGGSGDPKDPDLQRLAANLGLLLSRTPTVVLCAGVRQGLIGTFAKACISAGGTVCGVILRKEYEAAKLLDGLHTLEIVSSSDERKRVFQQRADVFVGLPGGIGTIDEIIGVAARRQLGECSKPLVIINPKGYYNKLLDMFSKAADEHLQHPRHVEALAIVSRLEELPGALFSTNSK